MLFGLNTLKLVQQTKHKLLSIYVTHYRIHECNNFNKYKSEECDTVDAFPAENKLKVLFAHMQTATCGNKCIRLNTPLSQ